MTATASRSTARAHRYTLTFETPPPVDGHWSLTMYPQATGLLYPNEIDRYAVGATTDGLVSADGIITILIQHDRPDTPGNWLPVPAEPFYVDLRMWEPRPEATRRALAATTDPTHRHAAPAQLEM